MAGFWLIRSGKQSAVPFTILELWPKESAGTAAANKRRWRPTDWPRLGLLVAAITATLAMAQPGWKFQAAESAPHIYALGRAIARGKSMEVFVRAALPAKQKLRTFVVTLAAGEHRFTRHASGSQLRHGITFTQVPVYATMIVTVMPHDYNSGERNYARVILVLQPPLRPVFVNLPNAAPPSIERLLSVIPNVIWNQPQSGPSLWILSNAASANRYRKNLAGAVRRSHKTVVLCLGAACGPDMKVTGIRRLAHTTSPAVARISPTLFSGVQFSAVRVKQLYTTKVGAHWQTELTVGTYPWLIKLTDRKSGITWYWLASPPIGKFTNWQRHTSFVVFFANLISTLTRNEGLDADLWWRPMVGRGSASANSDEISRIRQSPRVHIWPLASGLALAAAIIVGISAAALTRRQ